MSFAVLALGGCGRKGPLDRPPSASSAQTPVTQGDTQSETASKPSVYNPGFGADAPPTAGKGPKRPFALDPLLNSN
jgi:predicted small lipoprotein YifL